MSPLGYRIFNGDVRAIARGSTLIESQTPAGRELSKELFSHTGSALTVGITGAPGAGKSTLVNSLIRAYRRMNRTVAVVAVDPSSPYSRGALLGDRVRMLEHHEDSAVFIRSMATRGRLGGVAATTLDLVLMLGAAGREIILIETVGVGQDEIDISSIAEVTVVVLSPGTGDDIQALKAGILEVADVIVINKADLPGADLLYHQIIGAQTLLTAEHPPVCKTSSLSNDGVPELLEQIGDVFERKRAQFGTANLWTRRLRLKLRDDLLADVPGDLLEHLAKRVSAKIEDPHSAIMALKKAMLEKSKHGH